MPPRATVTTTLRSEHDLIRRAAVVLRRIAGAVQTGAPFPGDDLATLARFLREFAEHLHHRKEESLLLSTLAAHGADDAAEDVGALLRDHEETRELVYMLTLFWEPSHQLTPDERVAFVQVAETYCDRIERHMAQEEALFFPLAERVIPGDEKLALMQQFATVESERKSAGAWAEVLTALQARWS